MTVNCRVESIRAKHVQPGYYLAPAVGGRWGGKIDVIVGLCRHAGQMSIIQRGQQYSLELGPCTQFIINTCSPSLRAQHVPHTVPRALSTGCSPVGSACEQWIRSGDQNILNTLFREWVPPSTAGPPGKTIW